MSNDARETPDCDMQVGLDDSRLSGHAGAFPSRRLVLRRLPES